MENLSNNELEKTAAAYEELLVPAILQEWADHLSSSDKITAANNILDVACGTGALTRAIAKRLNDNGSVTGLDPNPGMLAVARKLAPEIDWRQGKAEELPFDDETFDLVLSQFGLMFFSSPGTALQEMHRVLKVKGSMTVTVFDSIHNIPAYEMLAEVLDREVGTQIGQAFRAPFSMGDTDKLHGLFSSAGMTNTEIVTAKGKARFSSPRHMVLADIKGWFPFAQIHLDDQTVESIVLEAESALKPFQIEEEAVQFDVPVHIIKAFKA